MAQSGARRLTNLILIGVMAIVVIVGFSLQFRSIDSQPTQSPTEITTVSPEGESGLLEEAEAEESTPSTTFTTNNDLSAQLWKTIVYMALILVAILLGARIIKRYGGERLKQSSSPDIRILGRRYINPKQSIVIVKVRNKELLLGITDQSIRLLYDFTPQEEENGTEFA